uniref:Exocyst subunit Exo70 family protein n=1 Tax=Oryza punctata TaxID=4537 RepID=A0A0E0KFH5_ORYPU
MALVAVAGSSRSTNTALEEKVAGVAALVDKWRPDDGQCSLFLHGGRREAGRFLCAAVELHRAMLLVASDVDQKRGDECLVRAQGVLEAAMRRLQLELELLLSTVRSNAVDGAISGHDVVDDTGVVGHIRIVADAMMAAGYGMECVSTFNSHRRAEFAAAVCRLLGFAPSQHAHFHKLTWEDVDGKVQSWHTAAGFAFNFAFSRERVLCHRVFAADAALADKVFAGIASDHAADLLAVAEAAVTRARRAPERLFHVLDVHATLAEILPAIACILGDKSEAAARATAALKNTGDAARGILISFEEAIQKTTSKAAVTGSAVHPLTRYVMNYLVLLADYEETLARIYQQGESTLPSGSGSASPVSPSSSADPIGRLVSVLQRKLDAMAVGYRSSALRSLFMANNTHYVGKKVRGSSKLEGIVGEDWLEEQMAETRRHVDAFVHSAWRDVLVVGGEGAEAAVKEAVATQRSWLAADDEMGDAVREAAAAAVVPAYRALYRRHGTEAWMTPGDVNAMISRQFGGLRNAAAGARPVAASSATPRRDRLRLTSFSDKLAHVQ